MCTILWRDPKKTLEAAKAMKLSAKNLLDLKIIDEIIPEPVGGAHRDRDLILENVRKSIENNLHKFLNMTREEVLSDRKDKFLKIGRNKGFVAQLDDLSTLSMKKNKLNIFIEKAFTLKNSLIISISTIIIILVIIFSL